MLPHFNISDVSDTDGDEPRQRGPLYSTLPPQASISSTAPPAITETISSSTKSTFLMAPVASPTVSHPRLLESMPCQSSLPVPHQQPHHGRVIELCLGPAPATASTWGVIDPVQPIAKAPLPQVVNGSSPVLLPSAMPFNANNSYSSSRRNVATQSSPLQQQPMTTLDTATLAQRTKLSAGPQHHRIFWGCKFVFFRILFFPKTVFVKGVSLGKSCLQRVTIATVASHRPRHGHIRSPQQQQYHTHHSSSRGSRHHFRSYQRPAESRDRGINRHHHRSRSESDSSRVSHEGHSYGQYCQHTSSRSRSQSRPHRQRCPSEESDTASTALSLRSRTRACCTSFINSYTVQVALVCMCLTGESFAQSVMCPFLYYMVRDFHVGPDIWIGYYAGLLWTGFWGANLVTAVLWGHLSDKYGRKVVLLFGLFMTSVSTLCLGLSTRYHDAMLALILQGACTGLVPISKCTIGELANAEQRRHDIKEEAAKAQSRLSNNRPKQTPPPRNLYRDHGGIDSRGRSSAHFSDVDLASTLGLDEKSRMPRHDSEENIYQDDNQDDWHSLSNHSEYNRDECDDTKVSDDGGHPALTAKVDFAARGYSALVIAMALGAAVGPWAGGSLARRPILGFESYPYFAPCLLASLLGIILTGVVALLLNETHPKWATPSEQGWALENSTRAEHDSVAPTQARGRSGLSEPRGFTGGVALQPELAGLSTSSKAAISEPVAIQQQQAETGRTTHSLISISTAPSTASSQLSPVIELCLILGIYTLLVLTSILSSEFTMLYTQSPTFRGGLEFSAKFLGQVLTVRGTLKLLFNLFGYPWMVSRLGLLKCLKLGILVIGTLSVFGMGWFVPWRVEEERRALLGSFDTTGQNGQEDEARAAPVGMGVILFCLSLISAGDVLGYISVLVLFGKSADRYKGSKRQNITEGDGCTQQGEGRGGSGLLWSLAQVSANVMRITGPVFAGLLWSLTGRATGVQSVAWVTGLHHPHESFSPMQVYELTPTVGDFKPTEYSRTYLEQAQQQQQHFEPSQRQSAFALAAGVSALERTAVATGALLHEPRSSFWTISAGIVQGSTCVFYLVGAICVINFVACHILSISSSSPPSGKTVAVQPDEEDWSGQDQDRGQ